MVRPSCKIEMVKLFHKPILFLTGVMRNWKPHERLPSCSIRELFTRYLDITTPPSPNLLQHFATIATDEEEQKKLNLLATVGQYIFITKEFSRYYCSSYINSMLRFQLIEFVFIDRIQLHMKTGDTGGSHICWKFLRNAHL